MALDDLIDAGQMTAPPLLDPSGEFSLRSVIGCV